LAEPAPPADLGYVKGMWHYARGMARAARSEFVAAAAELDSLRAAAKRAPDDMIIILNPAPKLLKLAEHVLSSEIAARQKKFDAAIAHLRNAIRIEDELTYDEPPPWYHSTRNLLGQTLLEAGRAADAEAAYREDLRQVRETGWSLSGLERALRAQGKESEAAAVAKRLKEAWKWADSPAYRVRN
jgi:tetratricopeptide (TPR) repeat protein